MTRRVVNVGCALLIALPCAARAQQTKVTERPSASADDGREVLTRRVNVHIRNKTLREAVELVAARGAVHVQYRARMLEGYSARVSFEGRDVSLAQAFASVLEGTGLRVVPLPGAILNIEEAREADALSNRAMNGVVRGVVTDTASKRAIADATVTLEGANLRVRTDARGTFTLSGVPAGTYSLVVQRLGYRVARRTIVVSQEGTVTTNLALSVMPTSLDNVVTTVTGPQRRMEIANSIGLINADSVVKEAPITTLSQLLTARVPGLIVSQGQGSVGGNVRLQIRGLNSISLDNEPIVIVDGIRYNNKSANNRLFVGSREPVSPLNNLNPNDIETVEVVKGPSAATLYGTDAANGVIVITTKRGKAGPARWDAYGSRDYNEIPIRSVDNDTTWYGWGKRTGTSIILNNCTIYDRARGICTIDSVTHQLSDRANPAFSIFKPSESWTSGGGVSGGNEALRYYFGGNYNSLTGAIGLPDSALKLARARGMTISSNFLRPNANTQLNLTSNVSATAGPKVDLTWTGQYARGVTRSIEANPAAFSRGLDNPAQGSLITDVALNAFSLLSEEQDDRLTGALNGQMRVTSWLSARGTIGIDADTRNQHEVHERDSTRLDNKTGRIAERAIRQFVTSANFGATAVAQRGWARLQSSVGTQYVRQTEDAVEATGTNLLPGTTSLPFAADRRSNQTYRQSVTLGSYIEEMLGINDRLYLSGAIRVDGATGFGDKYRAAAYPKLGISWVASQEPFLQRMPGLTDLRLRASYGVSGKQAPATAKLPFLSIRVSDAPGVGQYLDIGSVGNSGLRPERSGELEAGVDAGLLDQRLQMGLTWYHRRTQDLIVNQLRPVVGVIQENIALATNDGFEAQITARVLDTRPLTASITLNHTYSTTKLVRLGNAKSVKSVNGGYVEGYPLGAIFYQKLLGYEDKDGDGVLRRESMSNPLNEVFVTDTSVFVGVTAPPRQQTLMLNVGVLDQRVRFSALLDRQTGGTSVTGMNCARCRGAYDSTTPLAEQAAFLTQWPVSATFTRLREITAAVTIPSRLTRMLRAQSSTISLSARNLALWTRYRGTDPESAPISAVSAISRAATTGIPQSRTWTLRLNLGL